MRGGCALKEDCHRKGRSPGRGASTRSGVAARWSAGGVWSAESERVPSSDASPPLRPDAPEFFPPKPDQAAGVATCGIPSIMCDCFWEELPTSSCKVVQPLCLSCSGGAAVRPLGVQTSRASTWSACVQTPFCLLAFFTHVTGGTERCILGQGDEPQHVRRMDFQSEGLGGLARRTALGV